ncbi:hypothetical protein [Flavobacterium sp.]|jgi:hypothetical protein|uniref:hypothetical protein n=1 Tax=Flavobacterium sp. TaxID=239 RepID=UPI00333F0439
MKSKILNFLLIVFSLFGYLEWSGNQHIFLLEAEIEIFSKLFINPKSVIHPFIILPIIAQFLLLFTLSQKTPSKKLTYISIFGLGLLLGFMLFVGLVSLNYKIVISTIPFVLLSILTILHHRKQKVK